MQSGKENREKERERVERMIEREDGEGGERERE